MVLTLRLNELCFHTMVIDSFTVDVVLSIQSIKVLNASKLIFPFLVGTRHSPAENFDTAQAYAQKHHIFRF
jgi:hypothetical protein